MLVKPLTVGPIVGATTPDTVRIWGRGELERIQSGPRRCFGIARIRSQNGRYSAPKFFKMNPNFDLTGIVIFNNLNPQERYNYQIGWFFSDLEPDELSARDFDWEKIATYHFTTAKAQEDEPISFVFGSCRYLLRLFGGSFFDNRGDKTFRSILEQISGGRPLDQIMMLGDQIYADDLNILSNDKTLDEYYGRYRDAFSQPHIRELMSQTPTYMTLDDHEIEDNWPADSSDRDWMVKYPAAIHAYQTYQISHSPLFEVSGDRITGVPDHFWYQFSNGCADFFVTDCRTERYLATDIAEREIISQEQMEALQNWLTDGSGRIKFMLSSVPVFPESKASNDDKWGGFPTQRSELLDLIREEKIPRVVFLSGDVHSTFSCELVSRPKTPNFKIISLTSSPYFWPYPHNPRRAFKLTGTISSTISGIEYDVVNAGKVYATDNFSRVTADPNGVKMEVYGRKGNLLGTHTHTF